jgi:Na+-transporting NADH:ubiquinone oxidoreductase subunit NqrF
MNIKRQCPITGAINELDLNISENQWTSYKAGGLAQNCFPSLTPDEREFIISGILPGEWDNLIENR